MLIFVENVPRVQLLALRTKIQLLFFLKCISFFCNANVGLNIYAYRALPKLSPEMVQGLNT